MKSSGSVRPVASSTASSAASGTRTTRVVVTGSSCGRKTSYLLYSAPLTDRQGVLYYAMMKPNPTTSIATQSTSRRPLSMRNALARCGCAPCIARSQLRA